MSAPPLAGRAQRIEDAAGIGSYPRGDDQFRPWPEPSTVARDGAPPQFVQTIAVGPSIEPDRCFTRTRRPKIGEAKRRDVVEQYQLSRRPGFARAAAGA